VLGRIVATAERGGRDGDEDEQECGEQAGGKHCFDCPVHPIRRQSEALTR